METTISMSSQPQSFVPGPEPSQTVAPTPAALFAARAERLAALAPASRLTAWLGFVASLATAQAHAHAALRDDIAAAECLDAEGRLDLAGLPRLAVWQRAIDRLAETVASAGDTSAAGAARRLQSVDAGTREALALRLLRGEPGLADLDFAPLIAAALELVATTAATGAGPGNLSSVGEHCPVCGSHAVAATLAATGTSGLRYLHCGWCNTAWHHVRAQCTHCHTSRELAYQSLEEGDPAWRAETCDHCHTYVKLFDQAKTRSLDPVADDLASLALDLALGEAGYRRPAANPYLTLASTPAA